MEFQNGIRLSNKFILAAAAPGILVKDQAKMANFGQNFRIFSLREGNNFFLPGLKVYVGFRSN